MVKNQGGIMNDIKKRSQLILVHPNLIKVADDYRFKVKQVYGFDLPRTNVTEQMAEAFQKMLDNNGIPSFKSEDKRIGHVKKKMLICNWEFNI